MNESNINKLRNHGLSNKKIAQFYDVNEDIIFNKPQTKKQAPKGIDNNHNTDINSILNMVVLCKNCRKEVNRDKYSHHKKLKEIAIEKIDKIMELAE